MDSDDPRHSLGADELRMRLVITQKMADLHARLGDALGNWAELIASDDGARGTRFIRGLLHEVTGALDDAYRRRLKGDLHPLEETAWVPALETVRNDLRRAFVSVSSLRGARLERAVEQLRRSMAAVQASG